MGYEGNTVIVFSVPVKKHGVVEGVLAGTYLLNRLTDNLNIKFSDGLGYSYVINNEGKIINSQSKVEIDESIKIKLFDGTIDCVVARKEK